MGLIFIGRQWPTNTSHALCNIRDNMKCGWKVTRLITASTMSFLAGFIFTCSAFADEIDVSNNDATINAVSTRCSSNDLNVLNMMPKACLIGGCIYGACSIIKFVGSVVNKGMRPFIELGADDLDVDVMNRHIDILFSDMLFCLFPEILAGVVGLDYAYIIIGISTSGSIERWVLANRVFGIFSTGFCALDTVLALCDMISFNVYEGNRIALLRRRDVAFLAWPLHPNNGEGMPMMALPPQAQDPGEMRSRG
ncbi:hypothetical protein CLAVI_000593 [Candidatus Clavichlamydia salmonicola]|uniref:hypothetical protein n=1 Tax=Candidatus Clavichlamydia salmonicola TaxID=469812 RepID=UPI001891D1BF|nr:hypothetical protein [Candidatus Clavichlamydia salmonicola]MBF5050970.1 hypothetical protein [Candidatus Clavichlamydia salmonicola]